MSPTEQSPYVPNSNLQIEKLVLKGDVFGKIWFSGNENMSPEDLIGKINELKKQAKAAKWFNLYVKVHVVEGDDSNLPDDFLVLIGDHFETDQQYKKRQESIILGWKRDHENFLRQQIFFESPIGQARIAATKPQKKPKAKPVKPKVK